MQSSKDLVNEACSFLFVPADRPDRWSKALKSGADVVVIDWEDAIAPNAKEASRRGLVDAMPSWAAVSRQRVLVRINGAGTPWFEDDVAAASKLVEAGCAGVVVPKAEKLGSLQAIARRLGERAVLLPLIETVAGLAAAEALAREPQVARLVFGHLDFQVDAGMHCSDDEAELSPVRLQVVLASRRAAKAAPIDGVTPDARNTERTRKDATRAWRQGFGGKLCIHPDQVAAVHAAFDPDADAVAWAERVQQAAAQAAGGVCVLDGRMVDAPVVRQAEQVLQRHARAQQRAQRSPHA